jgi:hypothetical protein
MDDPLRSAETTRKSVSLTWLVRFSRIEQRKNPGNIFRLFPPSKGRGFLNLPRLVALSPAEALMGNFSRRAAGDGRSQTLILATIDGSGAVDEPNATKSRGDDGDLIAG